MTWIEIDKELEWVTAWDKEDRHVGVISKHECVVDVDWVEELLTEVKRLRGVIAQVWDLMQNSNHEEREMFFWGFDKKNTGWLKVHEELAMKELNWGEEE